MANACKREIKSQVEFQSNNSFQTLIDHHPDTNYAMDLFGNILCCNQKVKSLLGYTSSEILGPFHKVIKKEDLQRVVNHFEEAVAGHVQQYDCICLHKDGHSVNLQVTNLPMFSNGEIVGVHGIATDITKHKLIELRLKEHETQFQHIYESLDLGVWSWDIRLHKVLYVSPAIETISGISPNEFTEGFRNWKDIIHPKDIAEFEKNQKDLRKGIPCQYQYRIIDIDGITKWVEASTFPVLDAEGDLVRLDGLITDISNKKLEEEKINYYAYHDYLTGLPNRWMFEGKLEQLISEKSADSQSFALLYLDLDRFKFINDTLGHSIGDTLLKKVSQRLANQITSDDHLARLGGDEFAIILNNLNDPNDSIKLASDIIMDIERQFTINEYNLHITTSIGIGIFPQDGKTVDKLSAHTDVALYRAKGMGKNNIQLYSPSMNIEAYKLFALERDLRSANMDEEFILHYQPKVDPKTRRIVGAEALIRWNHPVWGMLSPNEFIPLAEETNLILDLGDWVINSVCKQIQQWEAEGKKIVPISINISAKRFLKDDLVWKVQRIIEKTNVDAKWLEFEITETAFIHNEETALADITLLKEIGISISLDDFGTGYSSISYLKKFKVDYLKIDRSFINGIYSDTDDKAIVKSILYLAGELKMKVVAEGVETEEQLAFLVNNDCDLVQGFLFSKPVEAEVLSSLILKDRMTGPGSGSSKWQEVSHRGKYFRMDLPAPIPSKMTISEIDGENILIGNTNVIIENIGIAGLRVSTSFPLPVSKKMKLKIETEIFQKLFIVDGSILWKEEISDDHYQYGFEFELTVKEKDWLNSELYQLAINA